MRRSAYGALFARFAERVARIRPADTINECYWGGRFGARLNARGVSIPSGEAPRGGGERSAVVSEDDVEVASWALLEHDPLYELRLLSAGDAPAEQPSNAAQCGRDLAASVRRLPASLSVRVRAAAAGLADALPASVEAVLGSGESDDVLEREATLGGMLHSVLARAVVADALTRTDEALGGTLPLDGTQRDELVAAIATELGGSDRRLSRSLGRFGSTVALRLGATRPMERRRLALTEASAPVAGDVLMYFARGDRVRDFIAEAVTAVDGPVVLVAHSLGGIASVELLATRELPTVRLLVTVGSQAPFLYELDALPTLAFGAELPATVPRWVNIFDRRDLLAYTGAGIFPGRVEDREVDNRAPFPRTHTAYFANERFYAVLDEVLP